jgi:hypothetical protein
MKEEIKDTPEEIFIDWFKDHLMKNELAPDQGDIDKGIRLLRESYKQGYFCGREDLKQEIIADFDKKYREIFL